MVQYSTELGQLSDGVIARTLFQTGSLTAEMRRTHPELLDRFYTRRYENVGQYHSPEHAAAGLAWIMTRVLEHPHESSVRALRQVGKAVLAGMPPLFIAPRMLEAIMTTNFRDSIDWPNLPLPFEAGYMVLPRGTLRQPADGSEITTLFWARGHSRPAEAAPPCPSMITVSLSVSGIFHCCTMTAGVKPTITLGDTFVGEDPDGNVKEAVERMHTLMFGTFLVLNARPNLIQRSRRTRTTQKRNSTREFWTPNVIDFNRPPDVHRTGTATNMTTGVSPRMHWRRGHFTHQVCGKGLKDRKLLWIEPKLCAGRN